MAGTGKTRTLGAIREAHERRGHRVVGLGPTNVVARSLAADGFETAMTAHLALIHLRNGRDRWTPRTVVIVDEAAMLDTDILDRVMLAADRAGARLLLVGDDRQLQSVQRGGLFAPVAALAGSMELRRVQRQKTAWQREASEAFAAGDIASAIGAYADHDCLAWSGTLDESRAALVAAWAEASARDPGASRFIYASTNAEVKRLNAEARAIRVERGEVGAGTAFRTARGAVHAAAGDRIQFHDTDRHAGIFNGVLGTIVSCSEEEIEVMTDGGALVSFDPERFEGWGPGYAGTVYRGQGKTQTEVFALYDHDFAWSPSTSYVALTRQTNRVTLHVPEELAADRAALIRQMGRARNVGTSLDFAVRDELAPEVRENLDRLAWERIKADHRSLYDAAGGKNAQLPTPDLPPSPDLTWNKLKADHAAIFQAAENKAHLLPYQEGFDDFRGLVTTAIATGNHPEQHGANLNSLKQTLDTEAERRDAIQTLQGRIEGLTDRLDGFKEWVAAEPGRPIELAPGFTAWLRDRDATVAQWKNATGNPELKDHLPRLGEDGMKGEIERLSNPDLPSLFHPALETGDRHMERINNLYEHALAFVDDDMNLISWSPFSGELQQALKQALAEYAHDPDRVRELNAMSKRISASEEKAATARSLAEDLESTSSPARRFLEWSETGGRPIHEAPGFAEWRDEADDVLKRCADLSGDPELKAHCARAGASEESVRAVTAMLRDKRYQRPVVRQQVRQESMEKSRSISV